MCSYGQIMESILKPLHTGFIFVCIYTHTFIFYYGVPFVMNLLLTVILDLICILH